MIQERRGYRREARKPRCPPTRPCRTKKPGITRARGDTRACRRKQAGTDRSAILRLRRAGSRHTATHFHQ